MVRRRLALVTDRVSLRTVERNGLAVRTHGVHHLVEGVHHLHLLLHLLMHLLLHHVHEVLVLRLRKLRDVDGRNSHLVVEVLVLDRELVKLRYHKSTLCSTCL